MLGAENSSLPTGSREAIQPGYQAVADIVRRGLLSASPVDKRQETYCCLVGMPRPMAVSSPCRDSKWHPIFTEAIDNWCLLFGSMRRTGILHALLTVKKLTDHHTTMRGRALSWRSARRRELIYGVAEWLREGKARVYVHFPDITIVIVPPFAL